MHYAIIGGSGFIGTRLSQRLKQKEGVTFNIIDLEKSQVFPEACTVADVRDAESLVRAIPAGATIFNLAAAHRDNVRPLTLYKEVNVTGARNVCDAARARGVKRIVFTSSVAVYGSSKSTVPDRAAPEPDNEYGRTKLEAERIFEAWLSEEPDRTLVIVRPTVVFGERNRGNVYNLMRHVASRGFVMVGNGTNRKSMAYVENVAAFLEHVATLGPGRHIFNYVDKPDLTMIELVAKIRRVLGKSEGAALTIPTGVGVIVGHVFDIAGLVLKRQFPISAVRVRKFTSSSEFECDATLSGFVAPVKLLDGLERTIRFEFLEKHDLQYVYFTE